MKPPDEVTLETKSENLGLKLCSETACSSIFSKGKMSLAVRPDQEEDLKEAFAMDEMKRLGDIIKHCGRQLHVHQFLPYYVMKSSTVITRTIKLQSHF